MRLRSLLAFLLTAMITIGLFWFSQIPLGVTGEWTWQRIPFSWLEMIPAWIVAGIVFFLYLSVILIGLSRINFCHRWELSSWLLGLTAMGIAWSLFLQETPSAEYSLSKAPFVLYYKGSSGYFTEAQNGIPDLHQYLAGYEEKMKQGDVLHAGTHPPGLPLIYRELILLCKNYPAVQSWSLSTQPSSFKEAFEIIAQLTASSKNPSTALDSAVLWLATLITVTMSSLTVIPLFLISREFSSREVSWQVSAFWPLIPAALIFQPKSDALYSVISILFLFLWVIAWRRNSKPLYLLAGCLLWIGLFLTLAFLPVLLSAVLYSLFEVWRLRSGLNRTQSVWRQLFSAGTFGLLGLMIPTALLGALFEINLVNVWILNLENHAGFYLQYSRTYWKWLLINPVEISLALGLPLTWLVAKSLFNRGFFVNHQTEHSVDPGFKNLVLACLLVLGILWLSGKNMGEAARLWLIFLPWFLIMTIPYWHTIQIESSMNQSNPPAFLKQQSVWIVALVTQAIVCTTTVNRITGFHFPPG